MTKPKKAKKPKKKVESPGENFDEIMGALLKVPKKKSARRRKNA